MIDAVAIVLVHNDEIFIIERQIFLKTFPGYWAFPGGKVEALDEKLAPAHALTQNYSPVLLGALVRETKEELGIDLGELLKEDVILSFDSLGLAMTPDFNPYRFATTFFKVVVREKISLNVDKNEAMHAHWMKAPELLSLYEKGEVLAVPPIIKIIKNLGRNLNLKTIPDLNFEVHPDGVPWIESIYGVKQFMPLSNTLPPAERTNAFLIGDILFDPSPKNIVEENKLLFSLKPFKIKAIFLTHHHPDHHERSVEIAQKLNVPMMMSSLTHKLIKKHWREDYFADRKIEIVKEGDVVTTWLNHSVKVIEVPGHDNGQLAVMPENKAWFIAGDLFQGVGTVVIGGEESSMKTYMHTLEKVIQINPKVLFPSHGIGLGGCGILKKTLEHRKLREEQVLQFYKENKSEEEILMLLYSEISSSLHPYALMNIRSHLQKLRNEGKI